MQDIQEIWNRIEDAKRELRELKASYKDALNSTGEYEDLLDELKRQKDKKKTIEAAVDAQFAENSEKMERLAKGISTDKQMMADIALSNLLKGQIVKVVGPNDTEFEPHFSVRFAKKK
jgi:hypothetical protein